jgi:hypothetical protein
MKQCVSEFENVSVLKGNLRLLGRGVAQSLAAGIRVLGVTFQLTETFRRTIVLLVANYISFFFTGAL